MGKRILFAILLILSVVMVIITTPITLLLYIFSGICWVLTGKNLWAKDDGCFIILNYFIELPYKITGINY